MDWNSKKSKHYIFYYHTGSTAERDITKIIKTQESCYDNICEILKVKMNRKIRYFLCESPGEVGELYGDNEPANGIAKMPNEIFAVYNEKIRCIGFHEDVHLISYTTLGKPKPTLIREGLAMYFDKIWWGLPNEAWVQVFIRTGLYPGLSALTTNKKFHRYSDSITYPLAGVFVDYLVALFGIRKFKEFFKTVNTDFDKCFFEVFGISLDDFEDKFIRYIMNYEYGGSIYDTVCSHLKKKRILTH